jgi:hypothetical protein
MTPDDFRRIALKMNDATEGAHMGHPDFRANGKIFATLYPDGASGMVKLTPDQQQDFLRADALAFTPASGSWGRQGCTTVRLDSVGEDMLGEAMTLAWQNTLKAKVAANPKPRGSTEATKQPRKR